MVMTGHDSVTGNGENEEHCTRVKKRVLRLTLSLILTVLPLIGSLLVANLVDILRYGGLLGFSIGCFFPAALQLKSQYDSNKTFCKAIEQSQRNSCDEKKVRVINEETPLIEEFPAVKYFRWRNPCYTTPYETLFSHPYMVVFMTCVGTVAFCLTIASLPIRVHQDD